MPVALCVRVCLEGGGAGQAGPVLGVWQRSCRLGSGLISTKQTRLVLSRECKSMSRNTQMFTHQAANTPHRLTSRLMNNTRTTRRALLHASLCACVFAHNGRFDEKYEPP